MTLTEALHSLGYDQDLKGSQSKYVYRADDGTWICTMWNDRTDYDAGIAHINKNSAGEFHPGDLVRVVLIERRLLADGKPKISGVAASPQLWRVACIISPTPGFKRYRAILVRGDADVDVRS